MSEGRPTEVESVELRYVCPKCGAWPGKWCRIRETGASAPFLHSARFEAATRDGALPL